MKKLTKFLNSLGEYGAEKWIVVGKGMWVVGLVGVMGLSSLVGVKQRRVFLEAGTGKRRVIKEVVRELASQGEYQLARKVYQAEKLSGLDRWVYPQQTIRELIAKEESVLKESPYLKTALDNLAKLYESLGEKEKAAKYRQLSCWVKGKCD